MRKIVGFITMICFMSVAILVSNSSAHSVKHADLALSSSELSSVMKDPVDGFSTATIELTEYSAPEQERCNCKDWKGNLGLTCGVVLALPNAGIKVAAFTAYKCTYEWVNSYGLDLFPDPLKRPPRAFL